MLIFKFQVVFSPLYFFRNAEKGKYYCLEAPICIFGLFDYSFGSDLLLLVVFLQTLVCVITLMIWEPLVIHVCMLTKGKTDGYRQSRGLLLFKF